MEWHRPGKALCHLPKMKTIEKEMRNAFPPTFSDESWPDRARLYDVLQLAMKTGFVMEANWREPKPLSKSLREAFGRRRKDLAGWAID